MPNRIEAPGADLLALIWALTHGGSAPPPPPSQVAAPTLVYRPGGVAEGNVFTTWPTLVAAAVLIQGPKTVFVDTSVAPGDGQAHAIAGTWNLGPYVTFEGDPTATGADLGLVFDDGAVLSFLPLSFDNLYVKSVSTSAVVTFAAPGGGKGDFLFLDGTTIILSTTTPAFVNTGAGGFFVIVTSVANIDNGGSAIFSSPLMVVGLLGPAQMAADTITSSTASLILVGSSAATFFPTQLGIPPTIQYQEPINWNDSNPGQHSNIWATRAANRGVMDNTKTGITQLGSNTVASAGVTGNYATCGGGDQNNATADYATVPGGIGNTAAGIAAHASGSTSSATGDNSFAHGDTCAASVEDAVAMGFNCMAGDQAAVALGYFAGASALGAFACGAGQASGITSAAFGEASAAGLDSGAFGKGHSNGDYSFTAGQNCTGTGTASIAMGGGCTGGGDYSVAMGQSCMATGDQSVALGNTCMALGLADFAAGINCTANSAAADAQGAFAIGSGCSAVGFGAGAFGIDAASIRTGQIATASGMVSTPGDSQASTIQLQANVLGTGSSDEALIGGNQQYILEDGKGYALHVTGIVSGVNGSGTQLSLGVDQFYVAERSAGTTTFAAGALNAVPLGAEAAAWSVVLTVGVAPDRLVFTVSNGVDSTDLNAQLFVRMVEVVSAT
jgi:hypothetical protein